VYWHGSLLLISRHRDVKPLLAASVGAFGKGGSESTQAQEQLAALSPEHREVFRELLDFESLFMSRTTDEERHDRLRRVAHRAFTPRRIAAIKPEIEAVTEELVGELATRDEPDLADFAFRLPLAVIAGMLGIPRSDQPRMRAWSVKMAQSARRDAESLRAGLTAVREFRAYVGEIVARHRDDPDSVSELVAAMLDAELEDRLTTDELAAMFVVLIFAGHETTTNLITNGALALLEHREQWDRLCADRSLAAAATQELRRYVTPVQLMPRVAGRRVEAAGIEVEAGQSILLVLAAANRDPEVFADPERLDLTRPDSKLHLALGHGPRFCLGATLARLEGEVAFSALASAFPDLRLAEPTLEWEGPAMLRRPTRVPVTLGR
jgi:cytochrome P450